MTKGSLCGILLKTKRKGDTVKKIKILIGPAGVGKSTFIAENKKDGDLVLSSDAIRLELFGSLDSRGRDGEVFDLLHNRLRGAIKTHDGDIYYDATNTSRKTRRGVYQLIKKSAHENDFEIESVMLHKPLAEILEQNNQREGLARVPENVVRNMYKGLTIPRIGVDCDKISIHAPDFSAYQDEINATMNDSHNSPYHEESIREHIDMTIAGAEASDSVYHDELVEVAKYHDLGKSVTRLANNRDSLAVSYVKSIYGTHDRYMQHENVGAVYYLIANKDNLSDDIYDIAEVIQKHMMAHDGISEKVITSDKLNRRIVDIATEFAEIDSLSRVVNQDVVAQYEKLRELDDGSLLKQMFKNPDIIVSNNFERDLYTAKYAHGGVDFTDPLMRNARGLTLNSDSEIVTIGFEKFFNYKQLDNFTQYDDDFKTQFADLESNTQFTVYEKLDGTFIALSVNDKQEFVASTSSSTRTDFSKRAEAHFDGLENADQIREKLTEENLSLLFEFTSPDNLIIVPYRETMYTLIGARENDMGAPLKSHDELLDIGKELNIPVVESVEMTLDELIEYQKTNTDSEGFVAVNEYGRMIKFKTDYWFEQKANRGDLFFGDSFTSRKMELIFNKYMDDEIDDLLAFKNQHYPGMFTDYDRVVELMNQRVSDMKTAIRQYDSVPREQLASVEMESKLRNAVFQDRSGHDWSKNVKFMKSVFADVVGMTKTERDERLLAGSSVDSLVDSIYDSVDANVETSKLVSDVLKNLDLGDKPGLKL